MMVKEGVKQLDTYEVMGISVTRDGFIVGCSMSDYRLLNEERYAKVVKALIGEVLKLKGVKE